MIDPDGTVHALARDLDFRPLGRSRVRQAGRVLFHRRTQTWHVRLLARGELGPFASRDAAVEAERAACEDRL